MADWIQDKAEPGQTCSQLCERQAHFVLTEREGRQRVMLVCAHHYRLFLAKCNQVGDKVAIVHVERGASGKVN